MRNTKAEFEYEHFYHVYSQTNNKEILFRCDENKRYFLELIQRKLSGYIKIYAYALLGNHFHLAISIQNESEIESHILNIPKEDRSKTEIYFLSSESDDINIHDFISTQFGRVFNSYSQAINKKYKRKGNLFHSPFKRSLIKHESKLSFLIYYIHHNSRKHGLVENFLTDRWHSYFEIVENDSTLIDCDFVIEWFGGVDEFILFHEEQQLEKDFRAIWIE